MGTVYIQLKSVTEPSPDIAPKVFICSWPLPVGEPTNLYDMYYAKLDRLTFTEFPLTS